MGCFSKDQIKLIENNKNMIINLQDSNQPGSHLLALKRVKNTIFVLYLYYIISDWIYTYWYF